MTTSTLTALLAGSQKEGTKRGEAEPKWLLSSFYGHADRVAEEITRLWSRDFSENDARDLLAYILQSVRAAFSDYLTATGVPSTMANEIAQDLVTAEKVTIKRKTGKNATDAKVTANFHFTTEVENGYAMANFGTQTYGVTARGLAEACAFIPQAKEEAKAGERYLDTDGQMKRAN